MRAPIHLPAFVIGGVPPGQAATVDEGAKRELLLRFGRSASPHVPLLFLDAVRRGTALGRFFWLCINFRWVVRGQSYSHSWRDRRGGGRLRLFLRFGVGRERSCR